MIISVLVYCYLLISVLYYYHSVPVSEEKDLISCWILLQRGACGVPILIIFNGIMQVIQSDIMSNQSIPYYIQRLSLQINSCAIHPTCINSRPVLL